MRPSTRGLTACALAVVSLGPVAAARANETDNFTCRSRLTRDSTAAIDALVNAKIAGAVARANERGTKCGVSCLVKLVQEEVGGSVAQPPTFVPRAKLVKSIERSADVERCHLAFRDTIYGTRNYNHPWLLPFLGRTILVADSIRLSGRVVGLDKLDHFIREGLGHWRRDVKGLDIARSFAHELGSPSAPFGWTEYGLKGMSLTGVLSYADLAAEYSGYRFWSDLLSVGKAGAVVVGGVDGAPFVQQRPISLSEYVTDAWDEAINYSTFDKTLTKEVAAALAVRGQTSPVADCRPLAQLPDARLYVNPACLVRTTPGMDSGNRLPESIQAWLPNGRLRVIEVRMASISGSEPLTISSQSDGCTIGHAESGMSVQFLQRSARLDHGQSSARWTNPARRALRSTYRQTVRKWWSA